MPMMNGYWLGLGGLFMVLFWVFVRILDERLARGEIDAEEFRTRRVALEGGGR